MPSDSLSPPAQANVRADSLATHARSHTQCNPVCPVFDAYLYQFLVLGPSQTVSPPKYNILPLIFPSMNLLSNPVYGPSATTLTGTHSGHICLPTPSTCTSPSSLHTVFSPQARLSTNTILLRVHIVQPVVMSNQTNIFCAVLIHHDFIRASNWLFRCGVPSTKSIRIRCSKTSC